jgi:hypothetical protein
MSDGARAMTDLDLAACAAEPIQVPGSVQPHGVLLALDGELRVVRASANAADLLDRPVAELLGLPLGHVLDEVPVADLAAPDLALVNPMSLRLRSGRVVEGVASRSGGLVLLELEPVEPGDEGFDTSYLRIRALLQRLQRSATLEELVEVTAEEVRALTGFDRVMVYRFDPAWNGEVVAEARRGDLAPFLGLWYPAGDIPAQARALYAATWLRLIAAVDYEPAPILPTATGADGEPLDLGASVLRSVSPVHLEYLRNMGVSSSMSISLKQGDRLWGLVACHHQDRPHRPPYRVRAVAELVGQLVSTLLPGVVEAGSLERSLVARAGRGAISDALAVRGTDALVDLGEEVLALTGATGAVVRTRGRHLVLGDVPPAEVVPAIVAAAADAPVESLADVDPALAAVKDVASGALVTHVAGSPDQYVAWFRPELLRDVSWGGDPRSKVEREGSRISPRKSFDRWTETVRLRARPWDPVEVDAAAWLGRHLTDVLLREAQARGHLAETLQRTLLLESLPELPGAEVAARYRPGADDALGGDWYDVFWLPGGRVAVAIGDVAGHGIGVAPAMAQLRHGLRAYLVKEGSPADALVRLNELVGHLLPDDLASVVVVELDPATGRARMANAGHLPPVLVGAGGARLVAEAGGPALGVVARPRYAHTELELSPGDVLLLYTDRLVESRTESLDTGLERLRLAAEALPADLDEACESMLALQPGDDDVTVLALRRDGAAS